MTLFLQALFMVLMEILTMINNAHIKVVLDINRQPDASGNPVAPIRTETEWLACNMDIITREYKITVSGMSQQVKYVVILSKPMLRKYSFAINDIKNIALKDSNGNELGAFIVQNMEYLRLSNTIKFMVG
jgi:hypothetical protein